MAVCLIASLFSGCLSPMESAAQKKWVKKLSKVFDDDKFEYVGPGSSTPFGVNSRVARVKSKEYPDAEIIVRKNNDGELVTNYNYIRYQEDVQEYVEEYFDGAFDCEDYEIELKLTDPVTPIEDISKKEFIKDYLRFNRINVIIYKEDGNFQDDEEIRDILIDVVKDRDEACCITLYCCTEETDAHTRGKECECFYTLTMNKKNTINSLIVSRNGGKERTVLLEDEKV